MRREARVRRQEIDKGFIDDQTLALRGHFPRQRQQVFHADQPPVGIIGIDDDRHIGGGKVFEILARLHLGAARGPDMLMLGIGKVEDRDFSGGQQARQDLDQALRARRRDGLRTPPRPKARAAAASRAAMDEASGRREKAAALKAPTG